MLQLESLQNNFKSEGGIVQGWASYHSEQCWGPMLQTKINILSPLLCDNINILEMQNYCMKVNRATVNLSNPG